MWYKIPADSKQLTYLTLCFFFFFQDIFYQKKVLEVHYKNLNEFVILCLENYHMVYWIPWPSDTKSRLIRKGTDAKD